MNEDIKQEIKEGIEAQKSGAAGAGQNPPPQPKKNLNMLQDVVTEMLPRNIKATPEPTSISPIPQDALGRPAQGTEKIPEGFLQKPIRTYESDLAEALAKKQTSSMTIAIAESKRKEDLQQKNGTNSLDEVIVVHSHHTKQIILGFLSIIFIGGGIAGGYYLYEQSAFALPPPAQQPVKSTRLIPADKQVVLTVNSAARGNAFISQVASQFQKESVPAAKMIDFMMYEVTIDTATNKSTIPVPLTISSFMQNANTSMPDVVLRSLGDKWMLGAYTEDTGDKTLFLALSTDYFQNVFAGMLGWENSMPDDLADLFNYKQKILDQNLTASNTPASYFNTQGSFSDKVIRNRDVREFRNSAGELILLYSFIDKQTLIITTTESTFSAIIDRIEKQTYVR